MRQIPACPIFVVGAPRTGTTLTREILNLHPDIYLYDEVHYNERVTDRIGLHEPLSPSEIDKACLLLIKHLSWCGYEKGAPAARNDLRDAVGQDHVTHAQLFQTFLEKEALFHGKHIWGDSSPQDILYMERLKQWYPGAKFIAVVRDPRAFLASYKRYVTKGIQGYHNRYNPLTNGLLWRAYMRSLLDAQRGPLASDIYRLHYENLVTDPEKEIRNLCSFLGVSFSPEMLNVGRRNSSYHSSTLDYAQRGISRDSLDKWREVLNPAEKWLLERICFHQMDALGYKPETRTLSPRHWPALIGILTLLPVRLFNLLFRSRKPFTLAKVKRVLGGLGVGRHP